MYDRMKTKEQILNLKDGECVDFLSEGSGARIKHNHGRYFLYEIALCDENERFYGSFSEDTIDVMIATFERWT